MFEWKIVTVSAPDPMICTSWAGQVFPPVSLRVMVGVPPVRTPQATKFPEVTLKADAAIGPALEPEFVKAPPPVPTRVIAPPLCGRGEFGPGDGKICHPPKRTHASKSRQPDAARTF